MTKVAVAHDYVTQRGGAERVALAMLRAFPGAPLFTSLFDAKASFPGFRDHDVRTSPLQRIATFRRDPRLALPFLGHAWSSTVVDDVDVVLASSSGWAHGVRTAPGVKKVVYCHNPARWLYQTDEYVGGSRWRAASVGVLRPPLRRWDYAAASTADVYLANSSVVAARVRRVYGRRAEVLPPPVSVDAAGPQDPVEGLEPGFLLTVARGRGYKNTSIIEEALEKLPRERLVVVGGPEDNAGSSGSQRVRRLGTVTDEQLRWLYANARALVSVSYEDFGLTPIEAFAFGTPALLLRAGGFLDTMVDGVCGLFIDAATPEAVRRAVLDMPAFDADMIRRHADRFSESSFRARLKSIVADAVECTDLRDQGLGRATASHSVAGLAP
jgi:glycosyltransferase involved in cell wall biosynthesis